MTGGHHELLYSGVCLQESWQQSMFQRWKQVRNKKIVIVLAFCVLVGLIAAFVLLDEVIDPWSPVLDLRIYC